MWPFLENKISADVTGDIKMGGEEALIPCDWRLYKKRAGHRHTGRMARDDEVETPAAGQGWRATTRSEGEATKGLPGGRGRGWREHGFADTFISGLLISRTVREWISVVSSHPA